MTRKPGKTIADMESDFIFREKDAKQEQPVEDKRKATKEFVVDRSDTGLYFIKYSAGGEVPDALKGSWTNIARAQSAIESHLKEKEQRAAQAAQ